MNNKGRLIRLAALWNRRQIRSIRLNQEPIQRNDFGGFANIVGGTKRNNARHGDQIPQIKQLFAESRLSCKGMDDSACRYFPQDRQRIVIGITSVDDDRQIKRSRQLKLSGHQFELGGSGLGGIVVIQADLAYGARPGEIKFSRVSPDLIAIKAYSLKYFRRQMRVSEKLPKCLFDTLVQFVTSAYCENASDAGFTRRFEHCRNFFPRERKVRVSIEQFHQGNHMLPITALMRLTPADELCSFLILKEPSSFVLAT